MEKNKDNRVVIIVKIEKYIDCLVFECYTINDFWADYWPE